MTDAIQANLLDAGYVDAQHLLSSAAAGIDLVGPVLLDTSWQAAAGAGFDLSGFTIDWEQHVVTCPQGKVSRPWTETAKDGYPFQQVRFRAADCRACPVRAHCTRAATMPRQLALRPRVEHEALLQARQWQTTTAFVALYAQRSGIEGTMAQAAVGYGARRARYRTLPRVHLEHVALAAAISLQRLDDWWAGTVRAGTRTSRFATLAA
jgi:transposase